MGADGLLADDAIHYLASVSHVWSLIFPEDNSTMETLSRFEFDFDLTSRLTPSSISISLIYLVASRTRWLPQDPMLWFTMMLMPTGPPALKLTALAEINSSNEDEKLSITKFLMVSLWVFLRYQNWHILPVEKKIYPQSISSNCISRLRTLSVP